MAARPVRDVVLVALSPAESSRLEAVAAEMGVDRREAARRLVVAALALESPVEPPLRARARETPL
jgi:hypothetical protein